ncbi:GNAT family N-acetyltransferase [Fredinandcohnia sp. QZ13]|uniref:GNAT family N-acetyltransferase n=1 Tax=Fredinandcohnia sp. QZ13 TaxID=3073144 RepID=UPI0028533621|nr:GNAT family N-acetyltransferase [Fredinandcohnia sp. QZ13]MDR4886908.1 GNAT family N-acetyltransferase [Fredinandcohnia sp. QZ13]
MITIKRLSECTLEDAVVAWNKGFEGYYFDMTTTVDLFTRRMILEGLSPTLSVIAYDGERPVGLILNGIRFINGKKVSWNGGTGVDPEYRGKGVGKKLMEATLALYETEGVEVSTLEAVKGNDKAITLYEKVGYNIVDGLIHLQHTGELSGDAFLSENNQFTFKKGIPIDASQVPFYKAMVPWQTQWNNARDGESLLALDENDTVIGYAIFKRLFNEEGKLQSIILLQCETEPSQDKKEDIVRELLQRVFGQTNLNVARTAANVSVSNKILRELLENAGFKVKAEQVFMVK